MDEESLDDPGDPGENIDTVTVNVYDVTVSKTAGTSYTRDYDWEIDKSVDDSDAFEGQVVTYTINAGLTGSSDSDHTVSGAVLVVNNHPGRSVSVTLNDSLTSGETPLVNEVVNLGPAGSTNVSYSAGVAGDASGTNTVAWSVNAALNGSASDSYSFDLGNPSNEIDRTAVVSDPDFGGTLATLDAVSGSTSYSGTFTNSFSAGSYDNTACIDGSGDAGNNGAGAEQHCETVTVAVHALTVSKTAATSFDRTFTWDITKTVYWFDSTIGEDGEFVEFNPLDGPLTDILGNGIDVQYEVGVSTTLITDSAHVVQGTVTVGNPTSPDTATVTLEDVLVDLEGGFAGVSAILVPVTGFDVTGNGGTIGFTYWINVDGLGEKALDENQVTVTNTVGGATYDASASLDWSDAVANPLNASWSVTDPGASATDDLGNPVGPTVSIVFAGDAFGTADTTNGENVTLLTVTLLALPNIVETCGEVTWDNVVSLIVNDIVVDEAGATIVIDQTCANRLTRTPGYWKTHNDTFKLLDGPTTDETWDLIGPLDEGETFFLSGLSYHGLLTAPDGGSPYITLGRAYIAAELNVLAGTVATELDLFGTNSLVGVDLDLDGDGSIGAGETDLDVMALAEELLGGFDPSTLVGFDDIVDWVIDDNGGKFPTRKQLRSAGFKGKEIAHFLNVYSPMLVVAEYLDDYNNGANGIGPGHAD